MNTLHKTAMICALCAGAISASTATANVYEYPGKTKTIRALPPGQNAGKLALNASHSDSTPDQPAMTEIAIDYFAARTPTWEELLQEYKQGYRPLMAGF